MLIVLGGRPGTGKTSIARMLARRLGATYLRIDTIEQAMRRAGTVADTAGYAVAQDLAVENLSGGHRVVVDGVNPVAASRQGFRDAANRAGVRLLEVEIVCSDPIEHRRRVEARVADIAGHRLPSWREVMGCVYEPWLGAHLSVDTAWLSLAVAVARIEAEIEIQTPARNEP